VLRTARAREIRLPSNLDRDAANQLRSIIAANSPQSGDAKIRISDEAGKVSHIVLTPGVASLLMELLRHVGSGDAVTLVPIGQMLSTQQAADMLNISRPHLISLLEKGGIPYVLVGRHRRIRAEDLFAYTRQRDSERDAALSELAALDADYL
jgi:excisionase family DNA binding protein